MNENEKKLNFIFKWLKSPAPWFVAIEWFLTFLFAIASVIFIIFLNTSIFSYVIYIIAFVLLCYAVYLAVIFIPKIRIKYKQSMREFKYTKLFVEDFHFRSLVSASFSFSINMIYAIFQGVMAILSRSIWYGCLSAYYIILCSIRGGIVFSNYRRRKIESDQEKFFRQVKSYRNCGIYLNILTFVLTASIIQMVLLNQGYKYAGLMIYVMAFYTFYKLTISIINIVRANKIKDFTAQSIRNINLSDALVSILALQTAMLQTFGETINATIFNIATGSSVVLILIFISIIMIIQGTRQLNKLKKETLKNALKPQNLSSNIFDEETKL